MGALRGTSLRDGRRNRVSPGGRFFSPAKSGCKGGSILYSPAPHPSEPDQVQERLSLWPLAPAPVVLGSTPHLREGCLDRVPPSVTAGSPSFCCLRLVVGLCMDFEVCGLDLFSDFPEKEIYEVLEFVFLMRDVQEKV